MEAFVESTERIGNRKHPPYLPPEKVKKCTLHYMGKEGRNPSAIRTPSPLCLLRLGKECKGTHGVTMEKKVAPLTTPSLLHITHSTRTTTQYTTHIPPPWEALPRDLPCLSVGNGRWRKLAVDVLSQLADDGLDIGRLGSWEAFTIRCIGS